MCVRFFFIDFMPITITVIIIDVARSFSFQMHEKPFEDQRDDRCATLVFYVSMSLCDSLSWSGRMLVSRPASSSLPLIPH